MLTSVADEGFKKLTLDPLATLIYSREHGQRAVTRQFGNDMRLFMDMVPSLRTTELKTGKMLDSV